MSSHRDSRGLSGGPRTICCPCKPNLCYPPSLRPDANVGPFPHPPPPNKARRWGEPSLPMLKGYISSFKNLSTVTFVHRLESHWGPEDYVHTDWMNGGLDPVWSEITDLAISQLGSSTAGGPKMLKAVTVWGGDSFGPEVVVEEVVV